MNPLRTDLRVLRAAAGTAAWCYPLILLACLGLTWLPHLGATPVPLILGAGTAVWPWIMIGGRLMGLHDQARHLRLPGQASSAARLAALSAAVLLALPTVLYAARGFAPGLAACALALAAASGLLIAALPLWMNSLLGIAPGIVSGLLPGNTGQLLSSWPRASMLTAASLMLALALACYLRMRGRTAERFAPWARPAWMNLQQRPLGFGGLRQTVQAQGSRLGWIQGVARPMPPRQLQHHPEQALAYALGPGFAAGSPLATVLLGVGLPLAVLALWTPMLLRSDDGPLLSLVLANIIGSFSSVKFLQRLWLWRRQANLGLTETALLPGLGAPGKVNTIFCQLLLKRAIAAALPWLGLAWLIGLLRHAPLRYYPLALSINFTAVMAACAIILLCMRYPRGGLVMISLQLLLAVPVVLSVKTILASGTNGSWITPLWAVLLAAATGLYLLAAWQLGRRPHPWLLN